MILVIVEMMNTGSLLWEFLYNFDIDFNLKTYFRHELFSHLDYILDIWNLEMKGSRIESMYLKY